MPPKIASMRHACLITIIFLTGLLVGSVLTNLFSDSNSTRLCRSKRSTREVVSLQSIPDVYNTMILEQEVQQVVNIVGHFTTYSSLGESSQENGLVSKESSTNEETKEEGTQNKALMSETNAQTHDRVRVLCWVMTSPTTLNPKAIHVKATWGKRCDKTLFMSDHENKTFPTVGLGTQPGRDHLTAKTMRAFDYVYKNHLDDADWFLKADDDTYVIVDNLRYLLSAHAPDDNVYFGRHFEALVEQGFFSGGAGYVLSREALRRFGMRRPGQCANDSGGEDVEMGHCMQELGVKIGDSRDDLGRSRFHCFKPGTQIRGWFPEWYRQYDKYGAKHGIDSISEFPISFHYMSAKEMYEMEFFAHHLKVYESEKRFSQSVDSGAQDLFEQS